MKKQLGILTIALSTMTFAARAQDDKKEEIEKNQASERARSTQGIRTENELKDDKGEVPSNQYRKTEATDSLSNQGSAEDSEDLVLEKNQDQGLSSDDDGNGLTNDNNTTQSGEQRTNTPAVIQSTTSESGSPAILSGKDGTERDGTNNVQRAKPNIAGAKEPGNMKLSEKNTSEKNRKTDAPRVRKQEEQPSQSGNTSEQEPARKIPTAENTVAPDSTVNEVETVAPMTAKEQRKAKRQARRNNRKD